jgi:hypothetical protein
VDNWIGLKKIEATLNLESCPRSLAQSSCDNE